MNNNIEAVVFDWAGTTVDYGCFAPVSAFIKAFAALGLSPTTEETRAPMGLPKRDHVAQMLSGERLRHMFVQLNSREPTAQDVDDIYARFEPALMETLDQYADVLPDVVDTVSWLRDRGIAIGSTTGYTAEMMDVVSPLAKRHGYAPDCIVCPDDVGGKGRPYPYMLWRNLEQLEVLDVRRVVKIGDTLADIREGKHAGCITVGVLLGSSMVGLCADEITALHTNALQEKLEKASDAYLSAGADRVITSIKELPALIEQLEKEPPK